MLDHSRLDQALDLAARGFFVFPVVADGKIPAIKKWQNLASRDPAQIRAWWTVRDPVLGGERLRDFNVGIRTGRFGDSGYLVVCDVDVKAGARGRESLWALDVAQGTPGWLDTFTVDTPSGGEHYFFLTDEPVATSASRLGPGLDTRGEGGYVVAPGSTVNGVPYCVRGGILRTAPRWLVDAIGGPAPRTRTEGNVVCLLDMQPALDRGIAWLGSRESPTAVVGGRGSTAYRVAAQLKDWGISELACLDMMGEHWNDDHCSPPMEFEDLAASVQHAYQYGKKPIGVDNPTADFDPVEEGDPEFEIPVEGQRPKLFFELARDIEPDLTRMALVDDWLDQGAMSIVYGDSNVGKTFVVLSIAYAIATGQAWHTHRTEPGGVVYVAAEAGVSVKKRIKALRLHHGRDDFPLALVPCSVDLLRTTGDTGALTALIVEAAKALRCPVVLVVIDTVSRAIAGGNENAPEDMTAFVGNLDRIRIATKAHVMGVHHSGKDVARGARGHSSLRAATDTEIEVADGVIRGTKQRDMEMSKAVPFALKNVEIGHRGDGKPVGSAVVELGARAAEVNFDAVSLSKGEREVLECLAEAIADSGREINGKLAASTDAWIKWCENRTKDSVRGVTERKKQLAIWRTHRNALRNKGAVEMIEQNQWVMS